KLLLPVEIKDRVHVLGHVENDSGVAGLSGETGTSPAWEQRSMIAPAEGNSLDDILYVFGDDDANGHLPVVGAVGCVERPTTSIKAHFAADAGTQSVGKSLRIRGNAKCAPGVGFFEHGKDMSHRFRLRCL